MTGSMTKTNLANIALGHLGHAIPISDLDTDTSAEASALRLFYEIALEEMLRSFSWPFATKVAAMQLVEENPLEDEDTTERYLYSFRYPSDCLYFRKVINGLISESRLSRVHYKIISDSQGKLLLCNIEEPCCEYTATFAKEPGRWDPDFIMAFAYRLASYVAPMIIGNNHQVVSERVLFFWNMSNKLAQANALNEEQVPQEPDGELVLSRA